MTANPNTLEELCLESIADNIEEHIIYISSSDDNRLLQCKEKSDFLKKYVFKNTELLLINHLSEKLLGKLLEKKLLCDATLNIFIPQNTILKSVKLKNCKISEYGLRVLRDHKVVDLECVNLKNISIGDILDCISDWSVQNMTNANFSKCSFIDTCRHSFMVKITGLKNLRSLNLSYTELNQKCFSMICEDLKFLERIDISRTLVKDLVPLLSFKNQLKFLSIADLPLVNNLVEVITQLTNLHHLDASLVQAKIESQNTNYFNCPINQVLENSSSLPNLVSLDLSGWNAHTPNDVVYAFVESHPRLEYLGVVLNDVTFDTRFTNGSADSPTRRLIVGGLANHWQIKIALHRYQDRAIYVQKSLYHLFQLTNSFPEPHAEVFALVVPAMGAHSTVFGVQMAATACLYNLTKGDLSKYIHPNILTQGINLTLDAMSYFPKEFQLQKNSLLTLCNDRILQEIAFDRYRCAGLVLDALCEFEDNNINRMAVAICSILAAKISTSETSKLGARPAYMRKLLDMVTNRAENFLSDVTLKFTLSALWNLTDESPATCRVFLEQQGALLFLDVLKKFKDDSTIETKVLGLLNNIAEVGKLRYSLMLDSLIVELFSLLKSDNIDVSYFAAGIVAHLASDGVEAWTAKAEFSRDDMLVGLGHAIGQWKVPDSEMVAYRSFQPFFPLLVVDMDYQVQLWAVWAIHHVCSKNPTRYCAMLKEEKGDVLLKNLLNCDRTHQEIKKISSQIMETLHLN